MPQYFAMAIVKPTAVAVEVKSFAAAFMKKVVNEHGGVVTNVNNSGLRTLPYKMKGDKIAERFTSGSFLSFSFVAPSQSVNDIKKFIATHPEIIRANVYRADEASLPPVKQKAVLKLVKNKKETGSFQVETAKVETTTPAVTAAAESTAAASETSSNQLSQKSLSNPAIALLLENKTDLLRDKVFADSDGKLLLVKENKN